MANPDFHPVDKVVTARRSTRLYEGLRLLAFTYLYYILAVWSLQWSFQHTNASPFWPPAGVAFAVILLLGRHLWPGILVGSFFANCSVFLSNQFFSLPAASGVSLVIAVGNTLEALAGVGLMRWLVGGRNPLLRVMDVFKFTAIAPVAAAVSASIGGTAVSMASSLSPALHQQIWLVWWLGDTLSLLILVPVFLLLDHSALRRRPTIRVFEGLMVVLFIILVEASVFGARPFFDIPRFPMTYLIVPLIVLAAFRFSYWGATITSLITMYFGFEGTVRGLGPFASWDLITSMLVLQMFVVILTVTGLVLAAALHERQKAEDQVRQDTLRFQALVENSLDMVILMDRNAVVYYASPSVAKVLGYSAQEYVGRRILDLVHPEDKEYVTQRLKDVFAAPGAMVDGQCRSLHRDGSWRWVEGTARNLFHDPAIGGIVVNYRDISQRKDWEENERTAQLALKESEQRFRSMADTAPVMIWMSGADMISTFFNKAWLDFRGATMEEELGHGWIQGLHPDDIKRGWTIYMKSFRSHEPFTVDYRLRRRDGEYRWILATAVPRFTADRLFSGYIGSCIDITDRKLAEEVLRRDKESLENLVEQRSRELFHTQKELKEASRLADIGTLAATVAHELRNPLGVIQMAAYNLKRKAKSQEIDRHLNNIEKKVWEGNRIIDNLLSYSRIKRPVYERVALLGLLDECIQLTQSKFQDQNITISSDYEMQETQEFEADPHQLREIFINILNNACQAVSGPSGRVEVIVVEEEPHHVRVIVKDNGAGIAPEDMEKIFEPFFTRKSKGTGLGLTICNELVNMHGGRIEIFSKPGQETRVEVLLPMTRMYHEQQGAGHR